MDVVHRFCGHRCLVICARTGEVTHLHETDSSRLFTEALAAKVEAIFTDETGLVSAKTAL